MFCRLRRSNAGAASGQEIAAGYHSGGHFTHPALKALCGRSRSSLNSREISVGVSRCGWSCPR